MKCNNMRYILLHFSIIDDIISYLVYRPTKHQSSMRNIETMNDKKFLGIDYLSWTILVKAILISIVLALVIHLSLTFILDGSYHKYVGIDNCYVVALSIYVLGRVVPYRKKYNREPPELLSP